MITAKSPSVSIPLRTPHAPIHTSLDMASLAIAGNEPVRTAACPGNSWTWRRSAALLPKVNRCPLRLWLSQMSSELLVEPTLLGQLGCQPCPVVGGQPCICRFHAPASTLVGNLAISPKRFKTAFSEPVQRRLNVAIGCELVAVCGCGFRLASARTDVVSGRPVFPVPPFGTSVRLDVRSIPPDATPETLLGHARTGKQYDRGKPHREVSEISHRFTPYHGPIPHS